MFDEPTARSKFLFRATTFAYFLISIPLISVSTVLPTISVGEAILFIAITPIAVFVISFMTQFVVSFVVPLIRPFVTFIYLIFMVWIVTFLGGQSSWHAARTLKPGSNFETSAIVRDPVLYLTEQCVPYFTLVFILSTGVIGIRLLSAFSVISH